MSIKNGILLLQHIKVVLQTREVVGIVRHIAAQQKFTEEADTVQTTGNYSIGAVQSSA